MISRGESDLVISDRGDRSPEHDEWLVRLINEPDAVPYAGPFVLNRSHPLTEGLDLRGTVWAAGRSSGMPGQTLIAAGNVVLLSDAADSIGRHTVRLRWHPERSTVQLTPDWPVLIANVVSWRQSGLPGAERSSCRLGESVRVVLGHDLTSVQVRRPDGSSTRREVVNRQLVLEPDEPGLWTVTHPDSKMLVPIAVQAIAPDESRLSAAVTGSWGSWQEGDGLASYQRSLTWVAALAALVVILLHLALSARWQKPAGKAGQ